MHKRMVFFVLFFAFINPIIHLSTYAGGPEEGWLGVSSLNFSYKGKPLEFVRPHTHLAQLEKEVSDILPTNTPTNIVFVAISFIYDGRFKEEYIVGGPSNLPYSFESGWTSMMHNPVLEETQTAIRPFAPLLQRQEGFEEN